MARLTFRRLLLVGVAVGAAAAYAKREQVRQLLPGGASSGPEPSSPPAYSPPPPAPSNYDAPGPPANTSTPIPAPDALVTPEPGVSEPVEEEALQADDEAAVADAIADAAAAAQAASGHETGSAATTGAVDAPSQLTPEPAAPEGAERAVAEAIPGTESAAVVPEEPAAAAEPAAASAPEEASAAPETRPYTTPDPLPSAEADTQVMPDPIDEAAEEQAAAAEAAAIGGSPGNEYAGSELGEPATEAERPLAEAGQGVAEGAEQADAELETNAGPGDEGMSDAERQIEDAIEAADNPAIGETPDPVAPSESPAKSDDDDISGGDWQTWSGGAVKPQ